MRFPVRIKHRKQEAVIYGKTAAYGFYRVAARVAGKRVIQSFSTYSEARERADRLVRELANGDQSTALSAKESTDAITIRSVLEGFQRDTGRRISALEAVKGYTNALRKLGDHNLDTAVVGYLAGTVSVRRKDVAEAVKEFLAARQPLTKSSNGERPQLSSKYAYNLEIQLRRFAETFPGTAVCDLTKDLLDAFISALDDFAAKTRNHHRAAVRHFLQWCVRKDYLAPTHRLGEANGLRPEAANTAEVAFYTPDEFGRLLEAADGPLRVVIALGGLAGLRTAEILRLDWADVWRRAGHVEITKAKSKTRQRRIIEIVPALAAWLEPFRDQSSGQLWAGTERTLHDKFSELGERIGVPRKANALRHSFCTFHYAAHGNENLTAQQAGNSPNMIHGHYKGLATKADAEKWFNTFPVPTAANVI